jgi:hypothetical protein
MPKEAVLVEHGKPALPVHWTLCPSSEDHEAENDAMKAAVMLATARTEQVLAHMDAVLRSVDIDALCNSVASTELTD